MRAPVQRRSRRANGLLLVSVFVPFLALAVGLHAALRLLLGDSVALPLDEVSPLRLGGGYLIGALLSDLLLGRLLPWVRTEDEAAFVGFLCAIPVLAAVRIAVEGFGEWTPSDVLRVVLLALVIGVVSKGHLWRLADRDRVDEPEEPWI